MTFLKLSGVQEFQLDDIRKAEGLRNSEEVISFLVNEYKTRYGVPDITPGPKKRRRKTASY